MIRERVQIVCKMPVTCSICGNGLDRRQRRIGQTYCSRACRREVIGSTKREYACRHCGQGFVAYPRESSFCSRECAFAYKRAQAGLRKAADALPPRYCEICGQILPSARPNRKACGGECSRIRRNHYSNKVVDRHHHCKECGRSFVAEYGSKKRAYCSDTCSNTHLGRMAKAVRRARKYAVAYESVDPINVFERDHWRCHLCGVRTPRRMRGTLYARAPELDHILPLAKGGSHTYTNVACACRQCNQRKGDRPLGQLRLSW